MDTRRTPITYLNILRHEERPFKFVISRLLMKTGLSTRIIIDLDDFRIKFHPTTSSATLWLYGKTGLLREEAFLQRYLRPGDTVIDVGAHIGFTALVASAAVAPSGRVYALEPHPRIFAFLQENIRINGLTNVDPINIAASDKNGYGFFTDLRAPEANRISSVQTELKVPTVRLDDVAAFTSVAPTLLKVDVEGAELLVLRGATDLLRRTECVYFESNEAFLGRYGTTTREVFDFFNSLGFTMWKMTGAGGLARVQLDHVSLETENLIAARNSEMLTLRMQQSILPLDAASSTKAQA